MQMHEKANAHMQQDNRHHEQSDVQTRTVHIMMYTLLTILIIQRMYFINYQLNISCSMFIPVACKLTG